MPSRVADILLEEARNAGRAREATGAIWGGTVARLGQVPSDIMAQHRADVEQQQQQQERQQRLAIGGEHLRQIQEGRMDEGLTTQFVAENTQVDPESGHHVTNHQAVIEGLIGKGRLQAAHNYAAIADTVENHNLKMQQAFTTMEAQRRQRTADILGAILDVPETDQASAYATTRGHLQALSPRDPALSVMPTEFPGSAALRSTYNLSLSDAERYTRHKDAAHERAAGIKPVKPEEQLVSTTEIDPATGQPKVIATGGPAKKHYEQKPVLLDGKPALVDYDPATGKHSQLGQDVSDRVVPMPPASLAVQMSPAAQQDIETQAQMLVDGHLLPSQLSKRSSSYNAVIAKADTLHREQYGTPLNLTKLELDFQGAKRFASTMNSSQMVRFNGLAGSVVNTIDEVRRLGDELQQGGVQKWNQVKRSTIQQVYGNTPQSDLAARYVGAVNTLKEEFANLAQGGFAPTEAAWKLANQQINEDYGFKDMNASLSEVQRLVNFRVNAIREQQPTSVGGPNQFAPPPATPKPEGTLPTTPSVGNTIQRYGVTWRWDGSKYVMQRQP